MIPKTQIFKFSEINVLFSEKCIKFEFISLNKCMKILLSLKNKNISR